MNIYLKTFCLVLLLPLFAAAQTTPTPAGTSKKEAKKWVQWETDKLSKAGAGDTVSIWGLLYYYGAPLNYDKTDNWLYNPAKYKYWLWQGAKHGMATAAFRLGEVYSNYPSKNRDSANFYYLLAADRGHVPAMLLLAKQYDLCCDVHALYW